MRITHATVLSEAYGKETRWTTKAIAIAKVAFDRVRCTCSDLRVEGYRQSTELVYLSDL